MIDINYYRKIQNSYETNDIREAQIYSIKKDINRDFNNSLDAYLVLVNGVTQDLIIITTQELDKKKIKSRPNERFYVGDSIEWNNSYWIVTEVDQNNTIITSGNIQQCNYLLKWQNEKGEVVERWVVIKSLSGDVESNNTISIADGKLAIIIPIDEETIKLKVSDSKKFFIDNNMNDPTTYSVVDTDNVSSYYNGHGIANWIVEKTEYSPTALDLEKWVCEYREVENTNETVDLSAYISGNTQLKVGSSRTYAVSFSDSNSNTLTDVAFSWNVVSDFTVNQTINNNTIILTVNDKSCIGKLFTLQVLNNDNVLKSISIKVIDSF